MKCENRKIENGYLILPLEFTEKGFFFRQLKRKGDVAVYEKIHKDGGKSLETIKIMRHEGYQIAGNPIPPAETYPSSEQWGSNGWTYNSVESAYKKFNSLI